MQSAPVEKLGAAKLIDGSRGVFLVVLARVADIVNMLAHEKVER